MNPIASVVQLGSSGLSPKAPKSPEPLTLVPLLRGLPNSYMVGLWN